MNKADQRELEKAADLSEKGRHDDAIAKLQVLQTSADTEVRDAALNYLADEYAATGRNSESESMLRRSIQERGAANEGLAWQLAVLAPVVRRQGRDDEAEQLYGQALEAMTADDAELKAVTMRNLAYLYWSTGREEQARELISQLPEGDEGFAEFLNGVMKPYVEPEIPL